MGTTIMWQKQIYESMRNYLVFIFICPEKLLGNLRIFPESGLNSSELKWELILCGETRFTSQ